MRPLLVFPAGVGRQKYGPNGEPVVANWWYRWYNHGKIPAKKVGSWAYRAMERACNMDKAVWLHRDLGCDFGVDSYGKFGVNYFSLMKKDDFEAAKNRKIILPNGCAM